MWESESESAAGREYGTGLLTSTKHSVKTEGFHQRGNSWYVQCTLLIFLFVSWLKINIKISDKFAFYIRFMFTCRYVSADIPSDLVVQIGEANFHLHKVAIIFLYNE